MTDCSSPRRGAAGSGRAGLLLAVLALAGTIVLLLRSPLDPAPAPALVPQAVAESAVELPVVTEEPAAISPPPSAPAPAPAVTPAPSLAFAELMRSYVGPDQALLVEVVDEQAQRMPSALVEVWPTRDGLTGEPQRLETDAEGRCFVEHAPGAGAVLARKDGLTSGLWAVTQFGDRLTGSPYGNRGVLANEPDLPPKTRRVSLEIKAVAHVHGIVLGREGAPLAGAQLVFAFDFEDMPEMHKGTVARLPRDVIADAEGRFDVALDAPLYGKVHAQSGGESTPATAVFLEPGQDEELTLRLAGAFAIEGRVLAPGGAPLAAAKIVATLDGDVDNRGTQSDAQGRFRLALDSPGRFILEVDAEGFIERLPVAVDLGEARPIARVDVELVPAETIEGVVVDPAGQPVTSFGVQAWAEDPLTGAMAGGHRYLMTFGFGHLAKSAEEKSNHFSIGPVSPFRSYMVCADETRLDHVRGGTKDVRLVLVPKIEAVVRGRVLDAASGQPVRRFEARLDGGNNQATWFDDAEGRFAFDEVTVGERYVVEVHAPGYEPVHAPVEPTKDSAEIEVRLGHSGALQVSVRLPDGTPAAGCHLALLPVAGLDPKMGDDAAATLTGADGRAVFADQPPGPCWLVAATSNFRAPPQRAEVPSGATASCELVLAAPSAVGEISVHLTDLNLQHLAQTSIEVRPTTLIPEDVRPDWSRREFVAEGVDAVFRDVPPGLYAVVVFFGDEDHDFTRVAIEPGSRVAVTLRGP